MLWAASGLRQSWNQHNIRPLPVPWPSLARVLKPLGGQQIMAVAAPGVGKTIFAANWAAYSGVTTLYNSADTDPRTMTGHLAALATGHPRDVVKERLVKSPSWNDIYMQSIHDSFPNIVLDFTSGPDIGSVLSKCESLVEIWGETPRLIVIDTASDIKKATEDWAGWKNLWLDIRELARYLDSTVYTAHHTLSGPAASGTIAPGQSDSQFKADTFAEMFLGIHRSGGDEITVTVQKNRDGKSRVPVVLHCDYAHGRVSEKV